MNSTYLPWFPLLPPGLGKLPPLPGDLCRKVSQIKRSKYGFVSCEMRYRRVLDNPRMIYELDRCGRTYSHSTPDSPASKSSTTSTFCWHFICLLALGLYWTNTVLVFRVKIRCIVIKSECTEDKSITSLTFYSYLSLLVSVFWYVCFAIVSLRTFEWIEQAELSLDDDEERVNESAGLKKESSAIFAGESEYRS